jgi:hypothetical protein
MKEVLQCPTIKNDLKFSLRNKTKILLNLSLNNLNIFDMIVVIINLNILNKLE